MSFRRSANGATAATTDTWSATSGCPAASNASPAPVEAPIRATRPPRMSSRSHAARVIASVAERVREVIVPSPSPGMSGTTTTNPARASPKASRLTSGSCLRTGSAPLTKIHVGLGRSPGGRKISTGTSSTSIASTTGLGDNSLTTRASTGTSRTVVMRTNARICARARPAGLTSGGQRSDGTNRSGSVRPDPCLASTRGSRETPDSTPLPAPARPTGGR
jgi:hypothetical protein